jgi:hypothetical protein
MGDGSKFSLTTAKGTLKNPALPGRGEKLTPELHAQIVECVRSGNWLQTAAWQAGVTPHAVQHWMRRGRQEVEGRYREFFTAIQAAKAQAEAEALNDIQKMGKTDWRARAWFLSRMDPKRFGEKSTTVIAGDAKAPLQVAQQFDTRKLTDAQLEQVRQAMLAATVPVAGALPRGTEDAQLGEEEEGADDVPLDPAGD